MERENKSVLVVDDDPDLRYMLSARLVSVGYRVFGAAAGVGSLGKVGETLD